MNAFLKPKRKNSAIGIVPQPTIMPPFLNANADQDIVLYAKNELNTKDPMDISENFAANV